MRTDFWQILMLLVPVLSTVMLAATVLILRHPTTNRRVVFSLIAAEISLTLWTAGRLLATTPGSESIDSAWVTITYLGAIAFGPSILAFALAWSRVNWWLRPGRLAILFVPPLLATLTLLTNSFHRLFFTAAIGTGDIGGLIVERGPVGRLNIAMAFTYLAVAALIYARGPSMASRGPKRDRVVLGSIILASLAVSLGLVVALTGNLLDLSMIATCTATPVVGFTLYRYWRTDLVRIAVSRAITEMGEGLLVLDLNGRILIANAAFSRFLGLDSRPLAGQWIHDLIPRVWKRLEDPQPLRAVLNELTARPGVRFSTDLVIARPHRVIRSLSIWPIQDRDGESIGQVATLQDVTETREQTLQLQAAHDEMRAVASRLESAIEDLHTLHRRAVMLSSARDLRVAVRLMLTTVRELAGAQQTAAMIMDRDGRQVALLADLRSDGHPRLTPARCEPCPLSNAVMQDREPRFVSEIGSDNLQRFALMSPKALSYAAIPLVVGDRAIGVLFACFSHPHDFSESLRHMLGMIAGHAAAAIESAQIVEELRQVATLDALTELPNHRHLMDLLAREITRSRRTLRPLALMMMDIDGFKHVNDTYGHTAGDSLLRQVAEVLKSTARDTDILGRYGGDEFVLLLPDTDREGAITFADRIAGRMRDQSFSVAPPADEIGKARPDANGAAAGNSTIPIRLSVGIAMFPEDSSRQTELVGLADEAMYADKRSGKRRRSHGPHQAVASTVGTSVRAEG